MYGYYSQALVRSIVKTRHFRTFVLSSIWCIVSIQVEMQPKTDKPRGLLNPRTGEMKFQLARYAPSEDLCKLVEHYWIVRWDLRGQTPYVSENLPYPNVNLVIETRNPGIFGVVTGKFMHRLEGQGLVFGVKFRPGAFYPLVKTPVSRFTD